MGKARRVYRCFRRLFFQSVNIKPKHNMLIAIKMNPPATATLAGSLDIFPVLSGYI